MIPSTVFLLTSLILLLFTIREIVETRVISSDTLELLVAALVLWGVSHIDTVETGYAEREPSLMEHMGTTVNIGGEMKTITNYRSWGHKYEFSDGTFADEGYVRRISNQKRYQKTFRLDWVWYWERFK